MAKRKRVIRRRKTTAKRKTTKRKTSVTKRKTRKTPKTATRHNRTAYWKAYRELQMKADKAWNKFRTDVRKNAPSDVLIRDHNHLRLLLGECNYMARECMRMAANSKMKAPKKPRKTRETTRKTRRKTVRR